MELHADVARGWFKGSKEELNRVWSKLESELNAAGPPLKSVAEWKKVWADQKKYVRQKAAQNLKFSRGTGGGPNMEQKLSANEEAIYNLIGMRESVEGVANTFGLCCSTSTGQKPDSHTADFLEFLERGNEGAESTVVDDSGSPQKPPPKKIKLSRQHLNEEASARDVLFVEINIQKQMLQAMLEQQQMTKKYIALLTAFMRPRRKN